MKCKKCGKDLTKEDDKEAWGQGYHPECWIKEGEERFERGEYPKNIN